MNANRGVTVAAATGTIALGGNFTYSGRFTGAGNTLAIGGAGDTVLTNTTGTPSNVNFDILASRLFFDGTNALGTGTVQVPNGANLLYFGSSGGTFGNGITVASGGRLGARTAVTYTNVSLPQSGTVRLNSDDSPVALLTIASPITLASGSSLAVEMALPAGTAAFSGAISGGGRLVKTGSGQLSLTGTNSYSGGTLLTGGTLAISGDRGLGAVPGSFLADSLTIQGGATLRGNGSSVAANRGITVSGSGFLAGGITVNTRFTSGTAGTVLSILDGENIFTNQTGQPSNVNLSLLGGRLFFNGTNSLGIGTVEVNNGANLVSTFTGTIGNGITVASGGRLSARAAMTYTNVSLPQSGTVRLNFDDTATQLLTITSPITLASGSSLTVEMLQSAASAIGPAAFSGAISGGGGLVKVGPGELRLTGANTFTGPTTVSAGTLLVNGTNSGTGGVTVASGATLGGAGSIAGLTSVSGLLSPGNSPGVISFDSLSLASTSTTFMEIDGTTRGSGYDGVNVASAGGLTYGGILSLSFSQVFADNTTFNLFDFTGTPIGSFSSITTTGSYGSLTFTNAGGEWTSTEVGGQTLKFSQSTGVLVIVPEPSALTVAVAGLAAAGWAASRRRRSQS
jgi:autotransporter-associated beta strand protein